MNELRARKNKCLRLFVCTVLVKLSWVEWREVVVVAITIAFRCLLCSTPWICVPEILIAPFDSQIKRVEWTNNNTKRSMEWQMTITIKQPNLRHIAKRNICNWKRMASIQDVEQSAKSTLTHINGFRLLTSTDKFH